MTIEGAYSRFAHLETVYLGCLARRTLVMRNVRAVVEAAARQADLVLPRPPRPLAGADRRRLGRARRGRDRRLDRRAGVLVGRARRRHRPARADRGLRRRPGRGCAGLRRPLRRGDERHRTRRLRERLRRARPSPWPASSGGALGRAARHVGTSSPTRGSCARWARTRRRASRRSSCGSCARSSTRPASPACASSSPAASTRRASASSRRRACPSTPTASARRCCAARTTSPPTSWCVNGGPLAKVGAVQPQPAPRARVVVRNRRTAPIPACGIGRRGGARRWIRADWVIAFSTASSSSGASKSSARSSAVDARLRERLDHRRRARDAAVAAADALLEPVERLALSPRPRARRRPRRPPP